jgi:hypothetical protein
MHFSCYAGIVLFLFIGFLPSGQPQAYADQLVLDNGDRISGKLISLTRDSIRIESTYLGIIQIERKRLVQMSTDNAVVVDLVSGERIIGQLAAAEEKTTLVRSSVLGERLLPLDAIDSINGGPPLQLSMVVGKGSGSPQDSASQSSGASDTQKVKPIGQKPEDAEDIRKIFLRQSAVLLAPGQFEVEAAASYLRNQSLSAILNTKIRQFQIPLAARIGLFNRAEGYVTVPIGYVRQDLAFADSSISHKKSGVGDVTAGFNYEIAQEGARRPDVIASFNYGAATGSKPNEFGLSLGSGHKAVTFGVQFIKSSDPVALFWGINYTQQFEAQYFLNDAVRNVRPGEAAGYNFGFGFAVNDNISFSAQLAGSYQSVTKADGVKVFGTSNEPVSLRSALTFRYSKRTYIEPSVSIGLDDETPDFILGFSLTHRFGKKGAE